MADAAAAKAFPNDVLRAPCAGFSRQPSMSSMQTTFMLPAAVVGPGTTTSGPQTRIIALDVLIGLKQRIL
jgi:hypothetical protein